MSKYFFMSDLSTDASIKKKKLKPFDSFKMKESGKSMMHDAIQRCLDFALDHCDQDTLGNLADSIKCPKLKKVPINFVKKFTVTDNNTIKIELEPHITLSL